MEHQYGSLETMHPEIRAFYEAHGSLKLDYPESPTMIFYTPEGEEHGYSIAISVAECSWLYHFDQNNIELRKGRPSNEWLYFGPNGIVAEEEMLKLIKLVAFW